MAANTDNKPFITGFLLSTEGTKKDILNNLGSDLGQIYETMQEAIEDAENQLNIGDGDPFFIIPIAMGKPEKYKLSYTAVKVTTSSEKVNDEEEPE